VSQLPLETCQTISSSWGFNITDTRYKPTGELIALLVRTAGVGGNLLLNVGPMPNGRITPQSVERLNEMGEWMGKWGHTIYGTTAGPVKPADWGAITRKGDKLYIHILNPEAISPAPAADTPQAVVKALALDLTARSIRTARWLNAQDPIDRIIEVTVK
jgi:alpha-L-fucosidase